jgi:hypothetical protein
MLRWLHDSRGDMVEGALTLPVMILVTLAFVNLALAGFSSVTASMAADYAARVGAVAQVNPAGQALDAAGRALKVGIGEYVVDVSADGGPGGTVRVAVGWSVPNFYGPLLPLFGAHGHAGDRLQGQALAAYRREVW